MIRINCIHKSNNFNTYLGVGTATKKVSLKRYSNKDNEAYSGKGGSSFWRMMGEVLVQDKTPRVTR